MRSRSTQPVQRSPTPRGSARTPPPKATPRTSRQGEQPAVAPSWDWTRIPVDPPARPRRQAAGAPLPHLGRLQPFFGRHDLSRVRAEVGDGATQIADRHRAAAWAQGERVGFRAPPDLRLAAHEAAHVIQQRLGARPPIATPTRSARHSEGPQGLEHHADAVAERVVAGRSAGPLLDAVPGAGQSRTGPPRIQLQDRRKTFPWIGKIHRAWSAALRRTPKKSSRAPHANTLADLPKGSEIKVVGRHRKWLQVQVKVDGKVQSGYVSQELVAYVRASAIQLPTVQIVGKVPKPSLAEAFVRLKKAETERAAQGANFKPDKARLARLALAKTVLEKTGKYKVDPVTYRVDFVQKQGKKVQVTTIEDFILFVEQVERTYPKATPAAIASEVRQLWFSDVNWELLVDSEGVKKGGKHVDIETEPNPIAKRFDMKTLAPAKGSKQFKTALGTVDVGHVMAGIDAALSGFPQSYPVAHLEVRENDSKNSKIKYNTLKKASGGNSADFTTWAGDLGQAYGEYLVELYVKKKTASLATFVKNKAPDEELLGDLHGYIAVQAWKSLPAAQSPTGAKSTVSAYLRDLYLTPKTRSRSYRTYLEKVSGQKGTALRPFIIKRSKAFARPWFAKKAYAHKGFWGSSGTDGAAIIDGWMKKFDAFDLQHEKNAAKTEKLGHAVDAFLKLAKGKF